MNKGLIIIGLLICVSSILKGQTEYELGILPQVNFNASLPAQWKLNAKVESRFGLGDGITGEGFNEDVGYIQTDVSLVLAHKVGVRSKVGGGYLSRFKAGKVIHRISQFYSTVNKFEGFKLGQRFLMDQTFEAGDPIVYRFRYRLSSEIPLQGQNSDAREFYLKANNEYLGIFEKESGVLEIRLVPILGFKLKDRNKIETGIDFRLKDIGSGAFNTQGWLYLGWYYSI